MQNKFIEIETAILKKRLKYLRSQGATGKRGTHRLGNDFFKEMEDDWSFCSAISDLFAVKEMHERREVLAATLPSSENEEWDEYDEDAEPGQLYARFVVKHLLSDEEQSEEPADVSETKSGDRADRLN